MSRFSSQSVSPIRDHIPEGHTIVFEGPQRCGKTLAMVLWARDAWLEGRKVFSNILLGYPHEPLEFHDLKLESGASRFWEGHIAIDELNFYFDARRSMRKVNIEFGAFLLQQKKQGCNLTGTTHDLEMLDVRLRSTFDFLVRPQVYPRFPETPDILKLEITNGPAQRTMRKTLTISCRPFLGLYDTFAVYDPFSKLTKPEKRNPK